MPKNFSCEFFLCDFCWVFAKQEEEQIALFLFQICILGRILNVTCPPAALYGSSASLLCPQEASPLATLPSVLAVLHSSLFTCHATLQLGCSSRSLFMFVNQVHYGFSSTLVSQLVTCAALLTYQYPKVSLHFSSLDPSFTFLKHLV